MTNNIRSKSENPNGLHARYQVTKSDGSPTDPNAVYFVLRLDYGGSDRAHVQACRAAAVRWCECAPKHLRQVADDLMRLLEDQEEEDDQCCDCYAAERRGIQCGTCGGSGRAPNQGTDA